MDVSIAPQYIEFHLEDFNHNITGYTPGGILKQIPNLGTYRASMVSTNLDESELGYYDKFHVIQQAGGPVQVAAGKYTLVIYGFNTAILAHVAVDLDWSENLKWNAKYSAKRLIYPNAVWTYEFEVPVTPPPNGQIVLTKVANPNDLIADITAAGNLDYIGNTEFVKELIKEVQKTEKERLHPEKNEEHDPTTPAQRAIKKYQKLLKEITEKYQKPEADEFVKQEAYTVLKEDIDYIIAHIQ